MSGIGWCQFHRQGEIYWWLVGTGQVQRRRPEGFTARPGGISILAAVGLWRGLLSTLQTDIETSCRMGGLHISGSKRVSFDGTLSIERQARKVQRLRNEAAAGELVCNWNLVLEPRSTSWMVRPSVPRRHESASSVTKTRPGEISKWIKLTERKCLEQRDRTDWSACPETALVDDRVGECGTRRFR